MTTSVADRFEATSQHTVVFHRQEPVCVTALIRAGWRITKWAQIERSAHFAWIGLLRTLGKQRQSRLTRFDSSRSVSVLHHTQHVRQVWHCGVDLIPSWWDLSGCHASTSRFARTTDRVSHALQIGDRVR
jgi:hypothetical protein